jgi:hypothetical protein
MGKYFGKINDEVLYIFIWNLGIEEFLKFISSSFSLSALSNIQRSFTTSKLNTYIVILTVNIYHFPY